jgi:hypothetical protein
MVAWPVSIERFDECRIPLQCLPLPQEEPGFDRRLPFDALPIVDALAQTGG